MAKPENEERSKEDEESSLTPKLEPLWAFSCEITKGCNITSMAWNKKNLVTKAKKSKMVKPAAVV